MTIAEIKRKARQFYKELNSSEIDYQALKNVIESLGCVCQVKMLAKGPQKC